MSHDPVRWRDAGSDAPPGAREVLREGGRTPPLPPDVRGAVLRFVVARVSGEAGRDPDVPKDASAASAELAPARGASLETTARSGVLSAAAKASLGLVLLLGAGGVVALVAPRGSTSPAPSAAPPGVVVPPAAPPASVASAELATELAAPGEAPAAARALPTTDPRPAVAERARSRHAPPPTSARESTGRPDTDSLGAESALVGRARELSSVDPRTTLTLVDEHERRFPQGELRAERDYLRVAALRRLGRADETEARARAFLAHHPSSPYAARVRDVLVAIEGR